MLAGLSWKEYLDWQAFFSVEPFPEERADYRNAVLCTVMVNLQRGKGRAAKVSDFMPNFWKEAVKQSPQNMLSAAHFINAMINNKRKEGDS